MNFEAKTQMKNEISAVKLHELICEAHPQHAMIFADQFALGCLLHMQGHKAVGRKLVSEVVASVQQPGNKIYLHSIRDSLEGNERRYAAEIQAHSEVNEVICYS
jgi:hypothetical protein